MSAVLILGGTGEARRLAAALADRTELRVISSLAGRVRSPLLPPGEVRIGGFGGVSGLAGWVRSAAITAVVDATHPFAAGMTAHAVEACARTGIPLLVLRRPGWVPVPGDRWVRVRSLADAASALSGLGERVLLTTGRQRLAAFAGCADQWFLVRSVDQPEPPTPARMEVLLDRGPFTVAAELTLLRQHRIDVVVTKDSGGDATVAKLVAAREVGLPVVMVDRPSLPAGVRVVPDVDAVLDWLASAGG